MVDNERRSMRLSLLFVGIIVALPQRLAAGDGPNLTITITGTVIDHETKQPIGLGCVVPGVGDGASHVAWDATASVMVFRGRYEFKCKANAVPHVLKAFAGDYQIAVSKVVAGKAGTASVDFELTKLPLFEATVRTPDGEPAALAKVAIAPEGGLFVSLKNGDADESMAGLRTDDSGRFEFRLREERFGLVIMHPTGYAIFQPVPHSKHRSITLDPWARLEGTVQVGGKPVPDTTVSIDRSEGCLGQEIEASYLSVSETAQTDAKGGFVFGRVLSGRGRVSCRLPQGPGLQQALKSTYSIETNFSMGRTVHLDFGKHCRTVVGTLRAPPPLKMRPEWRLATIELQGGSGDRQTREFKGAPKGTAVSASTTYHPVTGVSASITSTTPGKIRGDSTSSISFRSRSRSSNPPPSRSI